MFVSDYFAELFVAGRFADAGWNVYFPHRDQGFDFIATKPDGAGGQLVRPVQVKRKYPQPQRASRPTYGFIGKLTQVHPEMVLAIPFFPVAQSNTPNCIAYLPFCALKKHKRGYRCLPAQFKEGAATARRDYAKFFDQSGLTLVESQDSRTPHIAGLRLLASHSPLVTRHCFIPRAAPLLRPHYRSLAAHRRHAVLH